MTTPARRTGRLTGRTTAIRVHASTCGFCEEGGEWETPDHRTRWEEDHFLWTGHDGNYFQLTYDKQIPIVQFFDGSRAREIGKEQGW